MFLPTKTKVILNLEEVKVLLKLLNIDSIPGVSDLHQDPLNDKLQLIA